MMRLRLSAIVMLASLAGCLSSLNDEGEVCTSRFDCVRELECVIIDEPDAVCLPIPAEREQRGCGSDDDCVLSTGELWPLDADCIEGFCRCEIADDCDLVDDGLVFERETCRCVPFGRFGDACLSSDTCESGTVCSGGVCERE